MVLNGTGSDTNMAPLIFPNGSLHAMWRSFAPTPSHDWFGSKLHLLSAARWDDPATYTAHSENVFPSLSDPTGTNGAEDPFMWRSPSDGVFHVVLHNMSVRALCGLAGRRCAPVHSAAHAGGVRLVGTACCEIVGLPSLRSLAGEP